MYYKYFLFIGTGEIIFILIVLLFVFGPNKISVFAKDLGVAYRKLKSFTEDLKQDIVNSVEKPIKDEISKIDNPVEDSVKRNK